MDVAQFTDRSVLQTLPNVICPLCSKVVLKPTEAPCGHVFCYSCFSHYHHQRSGGQYDAAVRCPQCSGECAMATMRPSNAVDRIVQSLSVVCTANAHCLWTGPLDQRPSHQCPTRAPSTHSFRGASDFAPPPSRPAPVFESEQHAQASLRSRSQPPGAMGTGVGLTSSAPPERQRQAASCAPSFLSNSSDRPVSARSDKSPADDRNIRASAPPSTYRGVSSQSAPALKSPDPYTLTSPVGAGCCEHCGKRAKSLSEGGYCDWCERYA